MRIAIVAAVMAFAAALGGCAGPMALAPGSSLVQILGRSGPPTDIRFDRNGDELWEYATGPQGSETYLVRATADGKVKEVTQLLTDEQLQKIVKGSMGKADVRHLLGRPSELTYTGAGTVWSWRFKRNGVQPGFLAVRFSPDNTVYEAIAIMEPSGGRSSGGRDN